MIIDNNHEKKLDTIWVEEYVSALQEHYPNLEWTQGAAQLLEKKPFDYGEENRYQKPTSREGGGITGWLSNRFSPGDSFTIATTYRGLLCHKSPIDLLLYSACIWDVKPKTIIELGSFQGGSALWLADQMSSMGIDGEIHSYELLINAVSPRAKHPQLQFHYVDLKNLDSFNTNLLRELPHPWIVIDDAHVNVLNTLSFMREFMTDGDYFIKEDTCTLGTTVENAEYLILAESLGFLTDRIYTDAFGYNVTTAKNTWFILPPECGNHSHSLQSLKDITWEGA